MNPVKAIRVWIYKKSNFTMDDEERIASFKCKIIVQGQ